MTHNNWLRYSQVFPLWSEAPRIAKILSSRRKQHAKKLDSFFYVAGVPREPGAENLWHMNGQKIFQEPALMYLTGINQAGVVLGYTIKNGWTLFVPNKNPDREFWDGYRFGYDPKAPANKQPDAKIIKNLTGIDHILPIDQLEKVFKDACIDQVKNKKNIGYIFYHDYRDRAPSQTPAEKTATTKTNTYITTTDHNYTFYELCEKWKKKSASSLSLKSFAYKHFLMRLALGHREIDQALQANSWTCEAFLDTLTLWKKFKTEADIQHFLEYQMLRRSSFGLSFPSIIASGKNAATLHYMKNDEPLQKNSLVLLDFGVRCGTMHADISRTLPLSGRFNPLQALLYQIILDAQKLNEKNAVVGATIRSLNERVWSFIEEQLDERLIKQGGIAKRAYTKQPHGVSHLMGEAEHDGDPHRLYQDEPLRLGWKISNEPGLYGTFSLRIKGKDYHESLGIRIEDNLVIQRGDAINVSKKIPKEIVQIEKLLKA